MLSFDVLDSFCIRIIRNSQFLGVNNIKKRIRLGQLKKLDWYVILLLWPLTRNRPVPASLDRPYSSPGCT
jgi:hypothetical protein